MKIIRLTLIFIFFIPNLILSQSKNLENIIQNISKINVVEHAQIGDGSMIDENGNIIESENYKNYKRLKEIASIKDLIKLTNHENATVACYASWALSDTSYFDLKSILQKFIKNDREIVSYSGCNISSKYISIELYHRYWNSLDLPMKSTNRLLIELDSCILYSNNPNWRLIDCALKNRLYNESFNNQISYLAFNKGNIDAILYLNNWYKAAYFKNIKIALIDYMNKTNFEKPGITHYYSIIEELLKLNDPEIENEIITKLKKDKFWEIDKDRFLKLLYDNHIYNFEIDN